MSFKRLIHQRFADEKFVGCKLGRNKTQGVEDLHGKTWAMFNKLKDTSFVKKYIKL